MNTHWNTEEKMKDFNIENLERKNIYSIPENFFSDMQQNVMQEIRPQKKAKVINFNWAYAAAAAVATIFGVTFYMNQDETVSQNFAQGQETDNQSRTSSATVTPEKVEARMAYQTLAQDLTLVSNTNPKETKPEVNAVSAKVEEPISVKQNPEVQVDQILGTISSAELADLGRNVEQDVYLDLYY